MPSADEVVLMIYTTKGEFIQALKDYKIIENKIEQTKEKLERLNYLRFDKVRSPLDYDVVGYKKGKDNELVQVRQIKTGGTYNREQILETQEHMDVQIEQCEKELKTLRSKISQTDKELENIESPLKDVLIMRYKNKKKLKEVCKKYGLYLDISGMYKFIMRELDKYYDA